MTEKKTIRLIIEVLKTKKVSFLGILLLNILAALSSVIQPIAFQQLFDNTLPNEQYIEAIGWILAIVCIPLFFTLFSSIKIYLSYQLSNELSKSIRKELFRNMLEVKSIDLGKIGKGEAINRLTQQVGILCEVFIVNTLFKLLTNFTILIVTFIVLFSMSISLAFITMLLLPLFTYSLRKLRDKTRQLQGQDLAVKDKAVNYLQSLVSNIKSVHIFNGEQKENEVWEKWNEENEAITRKSRVFHNVYINVISDIIISIVTGIIYAYSLYMLINNELSLGTLLAFIVALPRLYTLFKEVFLSNIDLYKMKSIVENFEEIFELKKIVPGNEELDKEQLYDLTIQNLSFQYDNESNAGLNSFSLEVKKGECIGVVGISGSGKSTLFDLIHRHIEPQNGRILLNNKEIERYNIRDLRQYIGYNPQNLRLWNATLLENIIYPLEPDELDENQRVRVKKAVGLAQLNDFVGQLPDGIETVVNQNSDNLSGGEIQRIILARVLFFEPRILLFDEYTSALDAITENKLSQTIKLLKGDHSLVIIAHRLSTLKYADKIAVVDKGELLEFGPLDELLKQKGVFYQMYQAQRI